MSQNQHAGPSDKTVRTVITGATGLIGQALSDAWMREGRSLTRLSRRSQQGAGWAAWDPDAGSMDASVFEGARTVVHLAGENIAGGRWTQARKRAVLESRTRSTTVLCEALARCHAKPEQLITASGISIYGNRGEELLDESSEPGEGFLAEVCVAWEAATRPAIEAGIRVVPLRLSMVLAAKGSPLDRMLPAFRAGIAGRLSHGRQYMPWVALDDVVKVIRFVAEHAALTGPVNVVAPEAITNAEFTQSLAKVLHRPAILPLPALAIRTLFGQMGEELLLASTRAVPRALQDAGYVFRWPTLEPALAHLLGSR